MKYTRFLSVGLLALFAISAKSEKKPNIIYILADDLGYGDLSCYGQTKFSTPNIDKLAKSGIKFLQHYSGSTVCAPSRSTLMTGLHTGHTPIRGNKELENEGQTPMPANTVTLAKVLKNAGYATGAFGKWGLGFPGSEGDPNNQGFDTFYGYNCQRMAHRYYPTYLWDNQNKDFLAGNDWTNKVTYAPDVIHERALKFIEDNKSKPFFAYIPLVQPHAELIAPNDSILEKFSGKYIEDKPYLKKHGSEYGKDLVIAEYCSQNMPHAVFAAMVYRVDVYVGQILAKLEELGIADNTIVMFASDNGPHVEGGADPKFFNSSGGLRGVKRDLYEGGIRTAFICSWPNKIKAGTVSNHVSAFWDVLPTCAEIAGTKLNTKTDGISFVPELTGKGIQKKHEFLYWEYAIAGGRQAVRYGDWKGVLYNLNNNNAELELYNLANDFSETNNVSKENPEVVSEIMEILKNSHTKSEIFPLKAKN